MVPSCKLIPNTRDISKSNDVFDVVFGNSTVVFNVQRLICDPCACDSFILPAEIIAFPLQRLFDINYGHTSNCPLFNQVHLVLQDVFDMF